MKFPNASEKVLFFSDIFPSSKETEMWKKIMDSLCICMRRVVRVEMAWKWAQTPKLMSILTHISKVIKMSQTDDYDDDYVHVKWLKQVIRWYICFEVAKAGSKERWPQSPSTKTAAIRSRERSSFCAAPLAGWACPWLADTRLRPGAFSSLKTFNRRTGALLRLWGAWI